MKIDVSSDTPIFNQIAEQIEDNIFAGIFVEEQQIPSTTEISALLKINPHTVLKGMNLLVEENILYKKRGIGMFVSKGAVEIVKEKRRTQFHNHYITAIVEEAKKLKISEEELVTLIKGGFEDESNTSE